MIPFLKGAFCGCISYALFAMVQAAGWIPDGWLVQAAFISGMLTIAVAVVWIKPSIIRNP